MKWAIPAAKRNAVLLSVGATILTIFAAYFVASKHVWASERLAEIEPRYARLLGIASQAVALEAALADRRSLLTRHAYSASQDVARAGSDAQQRAKDTFSKAGLTVSSTQVLPAKAIEGFDRIPLVLRMEGELAAVQSALVILPSEAPTMFVDAFNVQLMGIPQAEGPQKLSMQVNLFVLRVQK